jgi:hypothetical protein
MGNDNAQGWVKTLLPLIILFCGALIGFGRNEARITDMKVRLSEECSRSKAVDDAQDKSLHATQLSVSRMDERSIAIKEGVDRLEKLYVDILVELRK